jgi:hypothetical protein
LQRLRLPIPLLDAWGANPLLIAARSLIAVWFKQKLDFLDLTAENTGYGKCAAPVVSVTQ